MKQLLLLFIANVAVLSAANGTTMSEDDDELKDSIEILDDADQKIGELPAERVFLPFKEVRGDARLGVTRSGHVYVAMGKVLFWSEDNGKTWQNQKLPTESGGFGIPRDDTFILFTGYKDCGVHVSTDYGRTWSKKIPLNLSPYDAGGGGWTHISQLPDGTALMTVTLRYGDGAKDLKTGNPLPPEKLGIYDHIFRSSDSGKTWGDKTLIVPDSAESTVIGLKSGKMLAAIRKQRHPQRMLPGDDIEKLKAIDGWQDGKPYIKHGFLADSFDNGRTWQNERPAPFAPSMKHGLCPADLAQLPDGRVVLIYTHRYSVDSGVMARVSHGDGKTWSDERYRIRLLRDNGHGTYPTNTVLADGTILTICGKNHGNRAIAIRWRLPRQPDLIQDKEKPKERAAEQQRVQQSSGEEPTSVRVASLSILPTKWDKDANTTKIERMVRDAAKQGARFVITPEGVLEGYVVNEVINEKDPVKKQELTHQFRELAEPIDGKYIVHFRKLADELNIYLILGFLEADGEKFYNTAALIGKDGELIGKYRKTHFAQGYDVNPPGYTPGDEYPVFDMGYMKVGMMICFDRTLPEPARLLALGGADLIACPAYGGWGELNTWRMRIRANENNVYVIFTHPNQSLIIDRNGELLAEKSEVDAIVMSDILVSGYKKSNSRISNRRPETFKGLSAE